jgi:hypothetical protein
VKKRKTVSELFAACTLNLYRYNEMFQFQTELPGCSQLQFNLFDWDRNGGAECLPIQCTHVEYS